MPKMVITAVYTTTNNYEQRTTNYSKQSQTNPIYDACPAKPHRVGQSRELAEPILPATTFGGRGFSVPTYQETISMVSGRSLFSSAN